MAETVTESSKNKYRIFPFCEHWAWSLGQLDITLGVDIYSLNTFWLKTGPESHQFLSSLWLGINIVYIGKYTE